jgi:hypothetical protein
LLEDRVRSIADGVKPGEYGRREAFRVHQALKAKGPVTVPREFVLMDRAAIGLGGVFLHLRAELNFYRLFNEAIRISRREGGRKAAHLGWLVSSARSRMDRRAPVSRKPRKRRSNRCRSCRGRNG